MTPGEREGQVGGRREGGGKEGGGMKVEFGREEVRKVVVRMQDKIVDL